MSEPSIDDPFAHLKQRASERADRTVERLRAAGAPGGGEAGAHRERLVRAADQLHAIIEFVEQEVAHIAVRVVDEKAGRPRSARTGDGGVGLGSHQSARALVLGHAAHHLV